MHLNNPVTPSQVSVPGPVGVDPMLTTLQSTEGGKTNASTGSTGALYCTCRGPYTGEFMISCDRCSEWYHGRCVGISPQEAEEWENQDYICSGCKTQKSKPSMNPTGLRRGALEMSSDEVLEAAQRGVGLPRRKRKRRERREEEGGRLGCRGKGHPNAATQQRGQGCQDREHPEETLRRGRLGCQDKGHPNTTIR
ncbi:BPTF [Mytilus coruscus]|uniref:BPTF n=1 Tax=Mytilus coruscus TaxID=42192 RepID=A0A6J8DUR9_MYTCO|nr:BPTF [Mytilus coruscus]